MVPDHSVVSQICCSAADQLPVIISKRTAGYEACHQTEVVLAGANMVFFGEALFLAQEQSLFLTENHPSSFHSILCWIQSFLNYKLVFWAMT